MEQKLQFEHRLDPELLAEIEEWEQQKHDGPEGYFFSNPDPYLKPAPLPPNHPRHNFWFDEDGRIHVKNLSAFWLPEFTLQREIGGTVYTVTGSYGGVETKAAKKMCQIPSKIKSYYVEGGFSHLIHMTAAHLWRMEQQL